MNIKRRSKIYWLTALFIAILAIAALQHVRAADPQNVRQTQRSPAASIRPTQRHFRR